jgi:hypothetical protein
MRLSTFKVFGTLALVVAATLLVFGFAARTNAEVDSLKCDTSTITAATVGHQLTSRIFATSSNRAFAIVQLETTAGGMATSSVFLAFNEDVAATATSGIKLSTSTPTFTFGLNTDFPYIGAVQAITDSGSTTVRVTECTY